MAEKLLKPVEIEAAFQSAYGRKPTKTEFNYWTKKTDSYLKQKIGVQANRYERDTVSGKYVLKPQVQQSQPIAPDVPQAPPDYYGQFAQSAQGKELAGMYAPDYLSATIDPYYNQQAGGEDYLRDMSKEQLGRNKDITTRNYGREYNDNRGIYGSGIYQQALGEEIGNLDRTFEQQYGAGQYTPFSQRKAAIEEQRRIAKAQATQQGQTAYSGAYQDYLQGLSPA